MSPPKGRLYSLSVPEREAMEKYISDSLTAGFIRPSSSSTGAGFFFVTKKDGSLRPCIDYRGLNNIRVKNTYPLPLMSSAFERLQGASIFTKWWVFVKCEPKSSQLKEPKTSVCVYLIYLKHKFHNLS